MHSAIILDGSSVMSPHKTCGSHRWIQKALAPVIGPKAPIIPAKIPDGVSFQPFDNDTASFFSLLKKADMKFLCDDSGGADAGLLRRKDGWNITRSNRAFFKNLVTVGVSSAELTGLLRADKRLWRSLLTGPYIHSVADEQTRQRFLRLGLQACNTGWYGLWGLTPTICSKIPPAKSACVVTDSSCSDDLYALLRQNYDQVFLLPSSADGESGSLSQDLIPCGAEYVGRSLWTVLDFLHMQRRSILIVSSPIHLNRVTAMGIPCCPDDRDMIRSFINSRLTVQPAIDEANIHTFLFQFL